ncbi:MAG: antibiotic biosynthesis monooxygenase [Treponema sp.]|nr:antibiotic biosynthesis monooxygenase [Treponema sp.]
MSITVNLRYTGKKGAAQAFAREMISSGTVEKIRAEKGNLRYEYYLPFGEATDNENDTILLIDSWENQQAIDLHHAVFAIAKKSLYFFARNQQNHYN